MSFQGIEQHFHTYQKPKNKLERAIIGTKKASKKVSVCHYQTRQLITVEPL